jgi:hypothetical protein
MSSSVNARSSGPDAEQGIEPPCPALVFCFAGKFMSARIDLRKFAKPFGNLKWLPMVAAAFCGSCPNGVCGFCRRPGDEKPQLPR